MSAIQTRARSLLTNVLTGTGLTALGSLAAVHVLSKIFVHKGHVSGTDAQAPYSSDWFPGTAAKIHLPFGTTQYYLAGPEDGPRVVLVHGMTPPALVLKPVADYLAARGFRVLTYDLYGRGHSDSPDTHYSQNLYVAQLATLLHSLGWTKFALLGYSLGGGIVACYTSIFGDRVTKLILVAPVGLMDSMPAIASVVVLPIVGEVLIGTIGRSVMRQASKNFYIPSKSNAITQQVIAVCSDQIMNKPAYLRAYLSTLRYFPFGQLHQHYERIGSRKDLSVLVVWGDCDTVVPFSLYPKLKQLVPQAQLIQLTAAGHGVLIEDGPFFLPQLAQFCHDGTIDIKLETDI